MNIAFSGCRYFTDYEFVESKLNEILRNNNFKILVGDAKGIDSLIIRYAKEYNFEHTVFKADWDQHGKSAGPIRNREMISKADGLIAFWNNESRGTKNAIEEASKKGIKIKIIKI